MVICDSIASNNWNINRICQLDLNLEYWKLKDLPVPYHNTKTMVIVEMYGYINSTKGKECYGPRQMSKPMFWPLDQPNSCLALVIVLKWYWIYELNPTQEHLLYLLWTLWETVEFPWMSTGYNKLFSSLQLNIISLE